MKRFSERLSTLSESAKLTEDIIDAARAKNQSRPEARRESNGKSLAGWIMSNGVPSLIIGTAVVMRYRHRRGKGHVEIAGRDGRRPGFLHR